MSANPLNASPAALARVLRLFVDTIDATGGVETDHDGSVSPVADPEWVDLGEAYIQACALLGAPVKIADEG